ncbi:MAG: hypothetical protein Kow0076_5080 [Francisella sp.]
MKKYFLAMTVALPMSVFAANSSEASQEVSVDTNKPVAQCNDKKCLKHIKKHMHKKCKNDMECRKQMKHKHMKKMKKHMHDKHINENK